MDIEEARAWAASPAVQRYLEQIDSGADAAMDTARSTQSSMRLFPGSVLAEYRRTSDNLDRAGGDFNAAFNQVTLGRARDGRAALAAYRDYVGALILLEAQNVRFEAYVRANVIELATRFIDASITITVRLRRRFRDVEAQLRQLQRDLPRLRREIPEAEAQRVLNVMIAGVSLLLPEVTIGAAVVIAASTFTVQILVDNALGPNRAGVSGVANNAVGGIVSVPRRIPAPWRAFGGAATALISFVQDNGEIADGHRNLRTAMRTIESLMAEMPRLIRALRTGVDDIEAAQSLLEGAVRSARSAADTYRARESEYRALERELAALR